MELLRKSSLIPEDPFEGFPTNSLRNAVLLSFGVAAACQICVLGLSFCLKYKRHFAKPAEVCIMSLGVGTMVADAMMHIFPEAILNHQHGHSHDHHHHEVHSHVNNVLLGLSALGGMTFVVIAEMVVHSIGHMGDKPEHSHQKIPLNGCASHDNTSHPINTIDNDKQQLRCRASVGSHSSVSSGLSVREEALGEDTKRQADQILPFSGASLSSFQSNSPKFNTSSVCASHCNHHHHGFAHLYGAEEEYAIMANSTNSFNSVSDFRKERLVSACFANAVAEIIHNIIDGISIGVAFKGGFATGVATSICILAHEVPMQFTDYVLFLKAGFGYTAASFLNFLVALAIVIGAILPSFGSNPTIQRYLLMATGGNFLALSFLQLLPEVRQSLMDEKKYLTILSGCFVLLGASIIAALGLLE